jgi:hypothetical protein
MVSACTSSLLQATPISANTGQRKANEKPTPHTIADHVLTPILKGKLAFFRNFSKTGQKSTKKANGANH